LGEYLQELGGLHSAEWRFTGDGWHAQITQIEDFVIGSLRVGQVRLEWQGNDYALHSMWPLLEKKLLRAGG
jgi:hypothetical protein